jgi:pimeloyl-ACP methyl ester carboxylesterase
MCPPAAMLKAMMGLEIPDEMLADIINARAATAKIGWNPLLHNPRLPPLLPRVTAPTLCLWGEHDQIVPLAYGQRYAELIPDAQLAVVPACGHLVPLERQPEFLEAVTSFLS